jgi:hypothetical protein
MNQFNDTAADMLLAILDLSQPQISARSFDRIYEDIRTSLEELLEDEFNDLEPRIDRLCDILRNHAADQS